MSLYYLNVTVHVLAAVFWLGGMFFMAAVGAPALRHVAPALRVELFRQLGGRFRTLGWVAIAVLLVTGTVNLYFRGLLTWNMLGSGIFWATPYGVALAWKLGGVATMLLLSALHDFAFGPAASRSIPGSPSALRLRRWSAWLARSNAIVALIVIIAAVRLARGG